MTRSPQNPIRIIKAPMLDPKPEYQAGQRRYFEFLQLIDAVRSLRRKVTSNTRGNWKSVPFLGIEL